MNTKKQLLPCEQGQYASYRPNRGLSNTHSRVFNSNDNFISNNTTANGNNSNLNLSNKRSNPRIKYVHKNELKYKIDNVNSLISYQYGPKFRDDVITDKPNKGNYSNIVSNTIQNFNEEYIPMVY